MNHIETNAIICLKKNNIEYRLCKIIYTLYEDERFKYEFIPNYNVIRLIKDFQGIPGINLELNKKSYIRENIIPVFISERAPNKNRENLWELLADVDLDYLNQLEWLIRTNTQYSGDNLYVIKNDNINSFYDSFDLLGNNSVVITKSILTLICSGINFTIKNVYIDDSNRSLIYNILFPLYLKSLNYKKEKQKNGIAKKKGRPSVESNILLECEIFELYQNKKISRTEAMLRLNFTQATFYRKYKLFKNE